MKYELFEPFEGKLDTADIVPKVNPLLKWDEESTGLSRVREHVRAKNMEVYNLMDDTMEGRESKLPPHFKSIFEISSKAPECPYPFNIDLASGGQCFNCIYCFSKYTESSLYSAWFDNYDPKKSRWASKQHVKRLVPEILNHKGVRGVYRPEKEGDWCGAISEKKGLKKAAAQRIPLRIGNRGEAFLPQEKEKGVALELLKILADYNYPTIITTKGTLPMHDDYFDLLTQIDDVAVQVSINHPVDSVARKLEPLAPPASARFKMIKMYNDAGIRAMIRPDPIMSFINTSKEDINKFIDKLKWAGVDRFLMDTYGHGVKSAEIQKMFYERDFPFWRMYEASAKFPNLSAFVINRFAHYFKEAGIETAAFNIMSVPYNDDPTCCNLGRDFENWSTYNLHRFTHQVINKGKLSVTEWDRNHYGEELHPDLRDRVLTVLNEEPYDPWNPTWVGGIYIDGVDAEGNLIYAFDEDKVLRPYKNLLATFKGDKT